MPFESALKALLTQIVEYRVKTVLHIFMGPAGNADAARLGNLLKACSYIDLVAQQVIAFGDYVADIDANTEADLVIGFDIPIALSHALLHRERAAHGVDSAGELKQQAVAGSVSDATTVLVYQPVDQFLSMGAQGA